MPPDNRKNYITSSQERITRYALALVLVLISFTTNLTTTIAQTPTTTAKSNQSSFAALPENQRLRIMIKMIKSGNHDQAEQLLIAHPLTGQHSANRTLFLEGLIAKVRKDYDLAAQRFRAALASDPKLTMVRAELAHTLFITEQDDGAKHHLQLLSGRSPNA